MTVNSTRCMGSGPIGWPLFGMCWALRSHWLEPHALAECTLKPQPPIGASTTRIYKIGMCWNIIVAEFLFFKFFLKTNEDIHCTNSTPLIHGFIVGELQCRQYHLYEWFNIFKYHESGSIFSFFPHSIFALLHKCYYFEEGLHSSNLNAIV